jgi:hypothetical protein
MTSIQNEVPKLNTNLSNNYTNIKFYMYKEAIIYQDMMSIYKNGTIQKYNNPIGWDETTYSTTPMIGRLALNIGTGTNINAELKQQSQIIIMYYGLE